MPATVMILAPRHPERFDAAARVLAEHEIRFLRRSQWKGEEVSGVVFLLDSIAELAALYSLATIAMVGGSFLVHGGHNILEPAQFGKAIVVGPNMENFRDILALFKAADAVRVAPPEALTAACLDLLDHPSEREALGRRAAEVFRSQAGATERTLGAVEGLLARSARCHEASV